MVQYTKKVDAFCFWYDDAPKWFLRAISDGCAQLHIDGQGTHCSLKTRSGKWVGVTDGEYIIRDENGDYSVCCKDAFFARHTKVLAEN